MKKITEREFKTIKIWQGRLSMKMIMSKSGRSQRTIERIFAVKSWRGYKKQRAKETAAIAESKDFRKGFIPDIGPVLPIQDNKMTERQARLFVAFILLFMFAVAAYVVYWGVRERTGILW